MGTGASVTDSDREKLEIRLVPPTTEWVKMAHSEVVRWGCAEISSLEAANFGSSGYAAPRGVFHIGSTAVPVSSKPYIDLSVFDGPFEAADLESWGYVKQGSYNPVGRRKRDDSEDFNAANYEHEKMAVAVAGWWLRILPEPQHGIVGFIVHCFDDHLMEKAMVVRALQANPCLADEYVKLKEELASSCNSDFFRYTLGKSEFLGKVHSQLELPLVQLDGRYGLGFIDIEFLKSVHSGMLVKPPSDPTVPLNDSSHLWRLDVYDEVREIGTPLGFALAFAFISECSYLNAVFTPVDQRQRSLPVAPVSRNPHGIIRSLISLGCRIVFFSTSMTKQSCDGAFTGDEVQAEIYAAQQKVLNSGTSANADGMSPVEEKAGPMTQLVFNSAVQFGPQALQLLLECGWTPTEPDVREARKQDHIDLDQLLEQFSPSSKKKGRETLDLSSIPDPHGIGQIRRQATIRFPASYRPPDGSCSESIKSCGLGGVSEIEFIAEESAMIGADCLAKADPSHDLSLDNAVALAAYSFDLRCSMMSGDDTGAGKDNFYLCMNNALHDRAHNGGALAKLRPFLYFLLDGWAKLPLLPENRRIVYRGLPKSARPVVEAAYRIGADVFWTTFVSTSTNERIAAGFAKGEGAGGIVFKITTQTGRDIKAWSALQGENEILLSPNSEFVVAKELHDEPGKGYSYVELVERPPVGAAAVY